jgi:hypothetical protein
MARRGAKRIKDCLLIFLDVVEVPAVEIPVLRPRLIGSVVYGVLF